MDKKRHKPRCTFLITSLFGSQISPQSLSPPPVSFPLLLHLPLSAVSSSWPLLPALTWFIVDLLCFYFQDLWKCVERVSAYIEYVSAVQVFLFMPVCVYEEIKTACLKDCAGKERTWCYLQRDLDCELTVKKAAAAACVFSQCCFFVFSVVSVKRSSCCTFSDGTETLSLRIQLDYSGRTVKINQNISVFLVKERLCFQRFTVIA